MNKKIKARIVNATVRFMFKGGQGVIVPGNLIVTAAHVVHDWSSAGGMALGDVSSEEVTMADGTTLTAVVLAIEPVADIAVLGAPDDPKQANLYEAAVESIAPVQLCTADFPLLVSFPVHIFTHTDRWVNAQATQCSVNASSLAFVASEGILGGTSGGPIVTDGGRLIGVVSTSGGVGMTNDDDGGTDGHVPRLHLTAPGWLVRVMRDPDWEARKLREMEAQARERADAVEGRGVGEA